MVIRADDLLTWIDHGQVWQWGLRAATVKPDEATTNATAAASQNASSGDSGEEADNTHVPTLKNTQLDFTDVNTEKGKWQLHY